MFLAIDFTLTDVNRLDAGLKELDGTIVSTPCCWTSALPDSDGLATLGVMQLRHPGVPIIVLSGLDDEDLAVTAVRDGAQDYLVKGKNDWR